MAKCLEQMMGDLSSCIFPSVLSYSSGSSMTKSWPLSLPQFPQQTLSFPVALPLGGLEGAVGELSWLISPGEGE